jgi:hypothetical protein
MSPSFSDLVNTVKPGTATDWAPSPDFSPGFRMMARSGWFWVRFWTA